jgi:2-iminobutanoate/2-iminopropanoate deaminase
VQNKIMKQSITAKNGPKPGGPYSPALRANGWVFVSGQIPADPETGQLVSGGIEAQCARTLENVELILDAAGLTLADVVKTTVFLKNIGDFAAMNETYGRYFPKTPPARTTVEVARLPRDVLIEIEAIAAAK